MSYLTPVRSHLAAIVEGLSGGARFAPVAPDATVETHPVDSCERRYDLVFAPGGPQAPMNRCEGSVLRDHALSVRVAYALTNAGGDAPEGLTPQAGPGEGNALEDRAALDDHDLSEALDAVQTTAVDPVIVDVLRLPEAATTDVRADRVVLSIPFRVTLLVTKPGSYAP